MGDEHMLKFVDDDEDFYVSIFLNQYRGFFKRLWVAVKYVFGYKCRYGHWDTWNLRFEDIDRLQTMLAEYAKIAKERDNKYPTFEDIRAGRYRVETYPAIRNLQDAKR